MRNGSVTLLIVCNLAFPLSVIADEPCRGEHPFVDATAEAFRDDPPGCFRPQSAGLDPAFEYSAGGVAGDFNRDGWQDLYVLGCGARPDKLYLNTQAGAFVDVALQAGINPLVHWGVGASVADVNGDGWLDIYVTSLGGPDGPAVNFLYVNQGAGGGGQPRFSEQAHRFGIAGDGTGGNPLILGAQGSAFGDFDLDGDLDLVITNFVDGARLFRYSRAAARFDEVSSLLEVNRQLDLEFGFAPRFVDMTGDRYPELLLAAFGNSRFLINAGAGTERVFLDSFPATCAAPGAAPNVCGFDPQGVAAGSTVGDYDGDGQLDWVLSGIFDDCLDTPQRGCACNESRVGNRLWIDVAPCRDCDKQLVEQADERNLDDGGWGWGMVSIDADHDGDLDVVQTNGRLNFGQPPCDPDDPCEEHCADPSYYFRNEDGRFARDCLEAFDDPRQPELGRGIVNLDVDNDGDQDVVVFHVNGPATLWANKSSSFARATYLRVLIDTCQIDDLAPDGFGVRLTARTATSGPMVRVIDGGSNHVSHSELSAHFGLAGESKVDLLVEWPNGSVTELKLSANQTLVLRRTDLDGDGAVNDQDLQVFAAAFAAGRPTADFNGDGQLDRADFEQFADAYRLCED